MKYKLIVSSRFESELDKAFEYISNNLSSPLAAKKLMSEINKSVSFAVENPYMYPLCPEGLAQLGFRKIAVKNYIVIYYVNEDDKTINLIDLFYGRRNYIVFFKD